MKIMVADDDHEVVDMLSYWLKGHGYDVIRAFDGEQAIKRWRETLPDLVILDIQMKPFSPRQLLARIKAIMRRSNSAKGSSSSSAITVGPVTLDAMRHEVIRDGTKVRLTPTESRLLHLLITHTG